MYIALSFKKNGGNPLQLAAIAGLLLAGVILLGGCSGAPAPQPTPTAARTQQPSPTSATPTKAASSTATPTRPASSTATPIAPSKPASQPTATGSPEKAGTPAPSATATRVPSPSPLAATPTGNAPAAPSSASLPVPSSRLQKNQAGNVTIEVTWEANQDSKDSLRFAVVMDTHSVDLDKYDIAKLASLRTDKGRQVTPMTWDGPPGGGHHRTGTLVFPAVEGGKTLIEPDTKYVEVTIRDVANVKERVLRWNLEARQ